MQHVRRKLVRGEVRYQVTPVIRKPLSRGMADSQQGQRDVSVGDCFVRGLVGVNLRYMH